MLLLAGGSTCYGSEAALFSANGVGSYSKIFLHPICPTVWSHAVGEKPVKKFTTLRKFLFRFTTQAKCDGKPRDRLTRIEFGEMKELVSELNIVYVKDILDHVEAEGGVEYLSDGTLKCKPGPGRIWRRLLDSIAANAPALCLQGDLSEMVSLLEGLGTTSNVSSDVGVREKLKRKIPLNLDVLEETRSSSVPAFLMSYVSALRCKASSILGEIAALPSVGLVPGV